MLIVFIVVPKNSGLDNYKNILKISSSEIIEVRGEDVPFWIEALTLKGKNAIGITGEDLFKEYCLKSNCNLDVIQKIPWNDEKALFNKPTLCLIGPVQRSSKKELNICIPLKYRNIAIQYLTKLEDVGYSFKKLYLSGCIEKVCSNGISDLAIDIVYTGSSLKKEGLEVYDKILESDYVIIGGKNVSI